MSHAFTPSIEWQCARDFVTGMRKLAELTAVEKWELGQHFWWFGGCFGAWRIEKLKNDPMPDEERTLIDRLISLFGHREAGYGDGGYASMSIPELCDKFDDALSMSHDGVGSPTVLQILTVVLPILIELWKRLQD